ncbi:hypothetical protein IL54_1773 [Sphingobium sp. ba1]|nr:hypothetical protein IL54_1773 [Sphingobium sp. ba1]
MGHNRLWRKASLDRSGECVKTNSKWRVPHN